ncbi:MAG: hypothetical protein FWD87_01190 [Spirochaetaceae bacterium]|nr:hypothetical protein [Spirochaetaceae bacterium]
MKIIFILPLVLLLCLIFSCLPPYESQIDIGLPDDGGAISLVKDLFKVVGSDDKGRKITTFLLNDNTYWSEYGYTLWTVEPGPGEAVFSTREVGLIKASGNNLAGYGFLICQGIRADYGPTMLTVMINTEQNYAIGKVIRGNYQRIKAWTHSSYLLNGYGRLNELKVTYDRDLKEYTLIINNFVAEKFKDETPPVHEGGASGYIVVVSPQDRFPESPVEIMFLE